MKLLLSVSLLLFLLDVDVFASQKTIQIFERTFPDQNIEISVIPINKSYISKDLLNTNIIDNQLIGFHIRMSNNGNIPYHLLLNQVVYTNVLGEELRILDKLDVYGTIKSFTVGWYWVAGIIGGGISEYFNKKGLSGLLQYFDDRILPPNATVSGIICFPFSHKSLHKYTRTPTQFRGGGDKRETSSDVSPYPIKNSELIFKVIDESSKLVVLSIIFDHNYIQEKITAERVEREYIIVDTLPKDTWPEW